MKNRKAHHGEKGSTAVTRAITELASTLLAFLYLVTLFFPHVRAAIRAARSVFMRPFRDPENK